MKAAIITSSDSGYAKEREDKSGPVIREILEANGYEVVHAILLPDEREMLAKEMKRIDGVDGALYNFLNRPIYRQ